MSELCLGSTFSWLPFAFAASSRVTPNTVDDSKVGGAVNVTAQ